jgi:20S proteasome alpha/beta subunit
MTIAIGLKCDGGIVLCADRHMTFQGLGYKYPEVKLDAMAGGEWVVGYGYAGMPELWKDAVKQINAQLAQYIGKIIGGDAVAEIASSVFDGMGDLTSQLYMLIAVWSEPEGGKLYKFMGSDVLPAQDFECLGVGDTSLVRFLKHRCLPNHPPLDLGIGAGIYFIKKAKDFIRDCGGETDVLVIRGPNPYWVKAEDISKIERDIDAKEAIMLAGFARDTLVRVDW